MSTVARSPAFQAIHRILPCGVELAVDLLPERDVVALVFRILAGVALEPKELTGVSMIVEQSLSKGTQRYDGPGLADAFDAIGAQWTTASGRQSTLLRIVCLPEYVPTAVELAAEMLRHPTFPDSAIEVAVDLALQDLKHMEDDPGDLVRKMIQRLTLGPVLGRHPGGELDTLPRINPPVVREHWKRTYHAGALQVAAAGPVDADALAKRLDQLFGGWGDARPTGREPAAFTFTPQREHRDKDLKQQYIAMTLPGLPREHPDFPVEQLALGVLSGGMSGRLFTEVREKQGLVYWVAAWHEQPRGAGIIHVGASTTPERCDRTFDTLRRELRRLGEDLTDEEVARARNSLVAHAETEDDLTRARAASLSEDLFFFGKPVGPPAKIEAVRQVNADQVRRLAAQLPTDRLCVATLGPRALS